VKILNQIEFSGDLSLLEDGLS